MSFHTVSWSFLWIVIFCGEEALVVLRSQEQSHPEFMLLVMSPTGVRRRRMLTLWVHENHWEGG